MKKLKLYLDTSVFNFVFATDAPEKRDKTFLFFKEVEEGEYEIYISDLVITEIEETESMTKKKALFDLISKYELIRIPRDEEAEYLADEYMKAEIIPLRYRDDAVHIAIAVVNNLDAIVSWNLNHIVKLRTRLEVNGINSFNGYKEIEICTPEEVIKEYE